MRVDLVWIDRAERSTPAWSLGQIWQTPATPAGLAEIATKSNLQDGTVLFWDAVLGQPQQVDILAITQTAGDVWHAGLCLGMGGLPRTMDFVDPVWRFNRDPDPRITATSWRLSLRACLVRTNVLAELGGPDPHFESITGASLELGHRWIRRGAFMRHVAGLIANQQVQADSSVSLPLADEIRFLRLRYGRMWAAWASWRLLRHETGIRDLMSAWRRPFSAGVNSAPSLHSVPDLPAKSEPNRFNGQSGEKIAPISYVPSVAILIPTLDRYPHLFHLLDQLRGQSTPPVEIVVVDQTEPALRDDEWPAQFPDLPLRVLWRDQAGQCSSRNAGLESISAETVLFLDDDDEVPSDLIERHLEFLGRFPVDASCGVAVEVGAGPLPDEFRIIRESDVFPTNNTLLKVASLGDTGLFDLAYEKGERADGDLGMRLYLAGKHLILNPAASVTHLHAPRGGLRTHDARVVTRSSSRSGLSGRHLLSATEAYLWSRYFSRVQVHEALLIRTVSTLRGNQKGLRRFLRAIYLAVLLPDTWRQNKAGLASGHSMLDNYPTIPDYQPGIAEEFLIS